MNGVPFRLYLVSDRTRMGPDPAAAVVALACAGLAAFQWREKDLLPSENLEWLCAIQEAVGKPRPWCSSGVARTFAAAPGDPRFHLFVNDRADLALVAGCHLHLAESSIPTDFARNLLPAGRLIGRSCHTLEGAIQAARAGADFITFGPVFDTPSKRGYGPPRGLAELHGVCATVPIPVFALGGVTVDRIAECIEAGAHGVAMIGTVWDDSDPVAALRRCLDAVPDS